MRNRGGVSLIETLVVMSACSTILTTTAVILHRAMQTQSKARAFLTVERNALRLSDHFRRDVHQTRTTMTSDLPENVLMRLQLNDNRSIEYHHHAGTLSRTELVNGEAKSREEFAFPPHVAFAVQQVAAPPRVILSMTSAPRVTGGPADGVSVPSLTTLANFQLEACVGRDARYVEVSQDAEVPQ